MKKREFEDALRALIRRDPFQPFVVELADGMNFEVDSPESVAVNGGGAAFILPNREVCRFDFRTVRRFVTPAKESA